MKAAAAIYSKLAQACWLRLIQSSTPCSRSTIPRCRSRNSTFALAGHTYQSISKYSHASKMKRKDAPTAARPVAKKPKPTVPEYHLAATVNEADGSVQWPAPRAQIQSARDFIVGCAKAHKKTLIVPDKDADGLSSGAILRHTLILLGLPPELIQVHLLSKGTTIHSDSERLSMQSHDPSYIFVVDHGSRSGPPVIESDHQALIIDHHHATEADFPDDSIHVTACHSPPVATSSLLTYLLCEPLHPGVRERCDWLCVCGTHGDLGNTLKWSAPFPDMADTFKKYTKKVLNDVVSLVNAPRRTATFDVLSAWEALCETAEPASVLKNKRLLAARAEVNDEVERCTHTAPKFSGDGKVAVFIIESQAQVHPVIATRWAGHLQSKALEVVMVANKGYIPGRVNFSCRIPRCARSRDPPISIIERLRYYASLPDIVTGEDGVKKESTDEDRAPTSTLLERVGEDFARGHVQASGGIVSEADFDELLRLMQVGAKPAKSESEGSTPKKKKAGIDPGQKNTLMSYFGKK